MTWGSVMATSKEQRYRVGELARRTGLTVRTLHHYDEIGLLSPKRRTASGHRLYGSQDLGTLSRITALKQLGLSLSQVAKCLKGPDADLGAILTRQVTFLQQRIDVEKQLCDRLQRILAQIANGDDISDEELIQTIEVTTMFEKHYTPEQMEKLAERAKTVGPERIAQVQKDWATLFAALDAARLKGTDPGADDVQALAAKASAMVAEFTGGDTGLSKSLNNAYQAEKGAMYKSWGISEELGGYYDKVMKAFASKK